MQVRLRDIYTGKRFSEFLNHETNKFVKSAVDSSWIELSDMV